MAALKEAAREHAGSRGEHEGATRDHKRACRNRPVPAPSLGGAQ